MHPRLRRQLKAHLAADEAERPALRKLWREVEAEYRKADQDHAMLQRSLGLLADLARRPAEPAAKPPRGRVAPLARLRRQLFERAPFAAFICDRSLEVLAWNDAAERQFGYGEGETVGREVAELLFPEGDRATVRRELQGLVDRGEVDQSLRVASSRTGEARLDEWTVVPLPDRDGKPMGAAVLVREPFASDDRFAVAWQGTGDGLFDWDLRADRLWLSDSWLQLVGLEQATGAPGDWLDRIHPSDRDAVQAAVRAHLQGGSTRFESEHRLRHQSGDWRWVLTRAGAVRDASGKATRLCGSMMDVSERRTAADRVVHDALHDPLTRLPNRSMFLDLMKRSFARTRRREGYAFAVLFLDIDHFKSVNDSLGHAAGDDLLVQTTRRLQTCLREGDTLARMGGDEFTVLVDDVKGVVDAQAVADRIRQATCLPFKIGSREIGESSIEELGVTEWRLANGVRVLLRPTDFKNDEILFTAFAPGGNSLAADDDDIAALTADSVIVEGGVGPFDLTTLDKLLADKIVDVRPYISELEQGLSGGASPRDLELMFQLIHLYMTAPRADEQAFASVVERYRGLIANPPLARPEAVFSDEVTRIMSQDHPRRRPIYEEPRTSITWTSRPRTASTATASPMPRASRSSSSATCRPTSCGRWCAATSAACRRPAEKRCGAMSACGRPRASSSAPSSAASSPRARSSSPFPTTSSGRETTASRCARRPRRCASSCASCSVRTRAAPTACRCARRSTGCRCRPRPSPSASAAIPHGPAS